MVKIVPFRTFRFHFVLVYFEDLEIVRFSVLRMWIKHSCGTDAFKYCFFPWTINEWNKLNFNIRTSSFNIFRANLVKIIQAIPNSVFGIFNPLGLKLITRLRLGLSHLNEHSINHNFNDCKNPLCTCSLDIESTVHFSLHYNYYNSARISLLNDPNSVDRTLLNLSDILVNVLLYGGPQFDDTQNAFILNSSIKQFFFFFVISYFHPWRRARQL